MNQGSAIVGLVNPKNPTNVGAVVRASHCFDADEIIYTGTRYDRAARFQTDTSNAAVTLPLNHAEDLFELIPADYTIVCIELAVGAIALPHFVHPARAAYLFGPEDGTLSQDTVNRADSVVFIPARSSLNLAATVNVVLYDRQAKASQNTGRAEYDQIIRASRDCRNRLRVL